MNSQPHESQSIKQVAGDIQTVPLRTGTGSCVIRFADQMVPAHTYMVQCYEIHPKKREIELSAIITHSLLHPAIADLEQMLGMIPLFDRCTAVRPSTKNTFRWGGREIISTPSLLLEGGHWTS